MFITTEKKKYLIGEVLELGDEAFQSYRNELKHRPVEDEKWQTPDAKHHFLLVVGEDSPDGVIVDLSGNRYENIPAFVPDARKQLDVHIKRLADYCVSEGLDNTEDGRWSVTYEELYHHFDGTTIASRNGMGRLLQGELRQRDEINELIMTEDCIEMTYHMEYCESCQESGVEGAMSLFSLMGCNLYDVHFCDRDEDHDLATVVELNQDTLTEDGKRAWSDVLNAKVTSIYEGHYGVQIGLTGCPAERLRDFSFMLAGHCSAKDYDRWVNSDSPEQTKSNNLCEDEKTEIFRKYPLLLKYVKEVAAIADEYAEKALQCQVDGLYTAAADKIVEMTSDDYMDFVLFSDILSGHPEFSYVGIAGDDVEFEIAPEYVTNQEDGEEQTSPSVSI